MANNLQLQIDEVVLDDYLLASIKQWERILLEDITIGSTCSRQSKRAVARENYFVRIQHQNQSGNRWYTYSNIYREVHHYLKVTSLPNSPPLLLAYIQQYKVLVSSSLIEQLQLSGNHKFINVESIRILLNRFQCTGKVRNREVQRTWFIDRHRIYKMMKALSGYRNERIEVTDDSGSDGGSDDGSDNDMDGNDYGDDVIRYVH